MAPRLPLTLCLILSLAASRGQVMCPAQCTCNLVSVQCERSKDLVEIPQLLPNNHTITSLIITGANMSRIPTAAFTTLRRLQKLELNSDNIERLADGAFQDLQVLESLALHRNYIRGLTNQTFRGLGKLRLLELTYNGFVELGDGWFRPLEGLEVLDLARNSIEILQDGAFSGLGRLKVLNLMQNKIMVVSGLHFAPLASLNNLIMDENDINVIENGSFSSLVALERLTLTGNRKLRSVQPEAFVLGSGSGSGSFPLEALSLKGTMLREVPVRTLRTLPQLTSLDLSLTAISRIGTESFSRQGRLVNLTLDSLRDLTTIEPRAFVGLASLQRLVITNNRMLHNVSAAVFRNLSSLRYLDLHNNGLDTVRAGLADWRSIGVVDLRGNPLRCDCHATWILTTLLHPPHNTTSSTSPGQLSTARTTITSTSSNDNTRNDVCSNVSSSKPPVEVSTASFARQLVCHMPPVLHDRCLASLSPDHFRCPLAAGPRTKEDTDRRLKVGVIAASVTCLFLLSCALLLKFRRRICSACQRQYRYKAHRNRGLNGGSPSAEIVELETTQLEELDSDVDTNVKF